MSTLHCLHPKQNLPQKELERQQPSPRGLSAPLQEPQSEATEAIPTAQGVSRAQVGQLAGHKYLREQVLSPQTIWSPRLSHH